MTFLCETSNKLSDELAENLYVAETNLQGGEGSCDDRLFGAFGRAFGSWRR